MLQQPSQIFMEKNSTVVYLMRSAWGRGLLKPTERDHYWGSLPN